MPTFEIPEASTKLAELIEQAQQGKSVAISGDGQVVATLVAVTSYPRDQVVAAIAAIKAMRTGSIDQQKFEAMRRSGRR